MPESPAQQFAAHLLAALAKAGVRNFFLAPGARSQSLAIAAGQLAEAGKIDLVIRIDDRSLGFLALGSALASGEPSVLITTSGTAVANLHPAVLEANHAGVPLILLTADRPHELRGVGANQTTNQVGIFADAVRECVDVAAPSGADGEAEYAAELAMHAIASSLGFDGGQVGPVQLNLAFREPLSAVTPNAAQLDTVIALPIRNEPQVEFAVVDGAVPTVVIAGAGAGEDAVELAESFGWPLFAEPSSGSRFGANVIVGYRALLESELAEHIGRAVVFGKPTLSRAIVGLLKNPDVEVVVMKNRNYGFFDVSRRAAHFCDELSVSGEPDFEWLEHWREADRNLATEVDALTSADSVAYRDSSAGEESITRREIVEAVWRATNESDQLLLGASRMIREADRWAPAKPIRVFSNRGLAGIDGTVATATGLALAEHRIEGESTGFTRALIGDLTLLHDAGSLAFDRVGEPRLNLQLIVINDNGGTIFEALEPAQTLEPQVFERLFKTPQNVDLWSLAQAYGWEYVQVENVGGLETVMGASGRILIEIKL